MKKRERQKNAFFGCFFAWEGHFLAFLCDNWVQNNEGIVFVTITSAYNAFSVSASALYAAGMMLLQSSAFLLKEALSACGADRCNPSVCRSWTRK